jgi:pimeloyl-ACP methyl ester carboxylesterase
VLFGLLVCGDPAARAQDVPVSGEAGVVFTVDGSGWLRGIADDVRQAATEASLPLQVEPFAWSHGPGRVFSDLHGHGHQKTKGEELAGLVIGYRAAHPTGKVYLVSHSSGAAVVLAAAELLPAGSVERVVLLAPALSPGCDLRPALRCSRLGVDSFHSQNDVIARVLAVVGTADGEFLVAAGCVGFTPPENGPDAALYARLRQYAWNPEMSKAGYYGGHFGCTHSGFFRAYLLPLLSSECGCR